MMDTDSRRAPGRALPGAAAALGQPRLENGSAGVVSTRRGLLLAGLALFAGAAGAQQCRRTPTDALGPYYLPNQPEQTDLCQRDSSPGMIVRGRIVRFPECSPVAGALIEAWHADGRGSYTRVGAVASDDLACLFRARLRSGADGSYAFRTLAPRSYGGRPPHIHFRVSGPGLRTLVTQMYLEPQEGIDPRLVGKSVGAKPGGPSAMEFDLNVAPL